MIGHPPFPVAIAVSVISFLFSAGLRAQDTEFLDLQAQSDPG